MMASDTTRLALRNLREAVLRTALTALGVSIGIASLVGMVSFGVAIQDQVVGSFMRSGLFDSITVTEPFRAGPRGGGRGRGGPNGFRQQVGPSKGAPTDVRLDDDALRKFAAMDRVREVFPNVRVPVQATYGDAHEFTAAIGVPMSARNRGVFQSFAAGGFFANDSDDSCLVSQDFASRLSDRKPSDIIGTMLTLAYASPGTSGDAAPAAMLPGLPGMLPGGISLQRTEKPFRIVGIVERQGGPDPIAAVFGAVMIPLSKARAMGSYDVLSPQALLRAQSDKPSYSTVTVRVERAPDVAQVEKQIRDMGFTAVSIGDVLQNNRKAFMLLDLFLGLVGSIALTVASLGIVNTMVMSILERTREIGIMKAIGGSDEDIRRIFLIEAALIGVMGGVFGLVLGWVVGRGINYGANWYLRSQGETYVNLFLIPWWLVAGGITFALLVSLIAGSFPAMRASRLDPIQALRHD